MVLNDRFTKGFLAGLIGGAVTTILGYLFFLIKFGTLRFADFAAIMVYGREAEGILEVLFAILIQWGFSAAAGAFFVYLLKIIRTENLIFKGWIFGVGIWFFVYIVTELFKIPELDTISLSSSVANFLASSFYGIVMANAYLYLEEKYKGKSP